MCDSRAPQNGADSARPYRVHLQDEEGPAWTMTVRASSPDMAKSIARSRAYEDGGEAVGVIGCEVAFADPAWGRTRSDRRARGEVPA